MVLTQVALQHLLALAEAMHQGCTAALPRALFGNVPAMYHVCNAVPSSVLLLPPACECSKRRGRTPVELHTKSIPSVACWQCIVAAKLRDPQQMCAAFTC
jgi:hypothetical protein